MSGYGFSAGYDAEDRVLSWNRADANLDQSWNLSPVGDWNSITENASTHNRTHGAAHELLSAANQSLQHDAKGNMTLIPAVLRSGSNPLAMQWDFENKLASADTNGDGVDDVFYKWDALGRRVGRNEGTDDVVYFQDGHQTLADYGAGAAAGSPVYKYIYASYIDEPVLRTDSSGTKLYYHRNQQYSVVALTDGVGAITERYAYTAYGEPTVLDGAGTVLSGSDNRYTYTGREWDAELSLYHYRARMYSPVAGRFVSRDPIGYEGSPWLLYAYTNASPVTRLDPMGLKTLSICLRWQYSDTNYFDCLPKKEREKADRDYRRTLRDNAIETYRKNVQALKRNVKRCCEKYQMLCGLRIDYEFKLKPKRIKPGAPLMPSMQQEMRDCKAGSLRVLIVTNHQKNPADEGPYGGMASEGIPFIWITSPSNPPFTTLSHECGHCGGYRSPGPSPPGDPFHNSDPDSIMNPKPGAGATDIDRNWCAAIGQLAANL